MIDNISKPPESVCRFDGQIGPSHCCLRFRVSGTVFISAAFPLCLNIDVASNEEVDNEIFESPEGKHSEKGIAS